MKLKLQNYVVIMAIEKSYIKFNNNKMKCLQSYDTAQTQKIVHKVVQRLSEHNLKI
jgi:RNA-splicing ligase RtcB